MANITNPQIIQFANEKCRRLANLIESMRRTCEQFAVEVAIIEQLAAYSGAQDADVILDGAEIDGRKVVTKVRIAELKYVAGQIAAAANQDDRETLVGNWVTHGEPLF
jgi:hypothetical protein